MKILLSKDKNYYKANLHCHTNCSDGFLTPEEIKKEYMDKGYSVVAFSDHEHLINHSDLTDDKFLALTASEIAIKQFKDKSTLKVLDMKVCHLNFISEKPDNVLNVCYNDVYDHFSKPEARKNIKHTGIYEREYSPKGINEIIKIASENGFLVQYNHPYWSLENYADYSEYNGLWSVEIYNNCCETNGENSYCVAVYDDMLRKGKKIFATMNDDNHNHRTDTFSDSFGGYNVINSENLTYDNIISSLKKGEFYCSTGPVIEELYYDNGKIYIECDKEYFISMSGNTRRTQYTNEKKAEFMVDNTDFYIRLTVKDNNGKVAHTNAYFVEELKKE